MHDVTDIQSINQSLFKAGNMAHKTNTGNRHIYKYTKHLKTHYDKEKEMKKGNKTQRLIWHTCTQHGHH